MKTILKLLLAFIVVCSSNIAYADKDGNAELIYLHQKHKTNKPRKPSNVMIICYARNGVLTFNPSDIYSSLFVTVTDEATGEVWTSIIDEDLMSMEFTDRPGHYEIECENEQGGCFVGAIDQ